MPINYDVIKLDKALEDFFNVTGVSISILSDDFLPVDSKKANNPYCRLIQSKKIGRSRCFEFNRLLLEECKQSKRPIVRICHAGLVEIAVPLIHRDAVIGYALLGHIRPSGGMKELSQGLSDISLELDSARQLFSSLETHGEEKLFSIVNMAEMFGRYLILDNLIKPKSNEYFERIKKYIEDNIDKKLTIQSISAGTYLSKSTLYSTVNSQLGISVNDLIYKLKIDRAKEMLQRNDLTVKEVSEALGFSASSYFGKKFKESVGVSPIRYKKENS